MKKKQILIFILSVLILVIFNNVFLSTFTRTNSYYLKQEIVNSNEMSPQRLFDRAWKIIGSEYYEPSLNHQDWGKWKNRYHGKIKTQDDAKVAIDTMIASLDEPYTRFMTKKDFEELTRDLLQKELNITLESFKNGKDQGIDLRYAKNSKNEIIIQCKHYQVTIGIVYKTRKKYYVNRKHKRT